MGEVSVDSPTLNTLRNGGDLYVISSLGPSFERLGNGSYERDEFRLLDALCIDLQSLTLRETKPELNSWTKLL